MFLLQRPITHLFFWLMLTCGMALVHESQELQQLFVVAKYEDRGVHSFEPRSITTKRVARSNINYARSAKVVQSYDQEYVLKYSDGKGHSYLKQSASRSYLRELRKQGPIQRRILFNTERQTYRTIDGNLTKSQYVFDLFFNAVGILFYWVILTLGMLAACVWLWKTRNPPKENIDAALSEQNAEGPDAEDLQLTSQAR